MKMIQKTNIIIPDSSHKYSVFSIQKCTEGSSYNEIYFSKHSSLYWSYFNNCYKSKYFQLPLQKG